MTVTEVAEYLGCSPGHVRTLVSKGKLKHKKKEVPAGRGAGWGYVLEISKEEAKKYKKLKFSKGWKRGRHRRKKGKKSKNPS